MKTKFIEARGQMNWGKFMVGQFTDEEWARHSAHPESPAPLLRQRGWSHKHFLVLDIETGEGSLFSQGMASADLDKHSVWVCPMFQPFLAWLYQQDLTDIDKLPAIVDIPPEIDRRHAGMYGFRRGGGKTELLAAVKGVQEAVKPRSAKARAAMKRLEKVMHALDKTK